MHTNLIVTAANRLYFRALETLISSIHEHSFNEVDEIHVYDIGLDQSEIAKLKTMQKVVVRTIDLIPLPYPEYLLPKGHAYKLFCVYNSKNYAKKVLWLDAGTMLLQNVKEIFNIIEQEKIFLVEDVHLNKTFTKTKCKQIMKATEKELNDTHLSSGIIGFETGGKYEQLFAEAFEYSKIKECIIGDEENHRHDQSVYSILASRYNCKKHNIDKYGYWTDLHRNIHTAREVGAVVFVHRRSYEDTSNIKYVN